MSFKKQKIIFTICLSLLIAAPLFASARGLVPCGGYVDAAGTQREPPCNIQFAFAMVARVTNWLIAVASIYAIYEIVNHAFWLVASLGNEESITSHRKGINNAIMGFVFVMAAYILINTAVNGILLSNLPDVNGKPNPLKVDLANPFNYLTK